MNEVDKMILDEKKAEIEELKSRINKAIEYIKNDIDYYDGKIKDEIEDIPYKYAFKEDIEDIISILKGE